MRERAVSAALINPQVPDDRREENDGRFDEEVALFLYPRAVEIQHNRVGGFVSVGYVSHEVGIDRVAAVRTPRVVEVDDVERRHFLVPALIVEQMVVSYLRQVGEFEVVEVHGEPFLDLLLDELIDDSIALSAARRSEYDRRAKRVHDVDPPSFHRLR